MSQNSQGAFNLAITMAIGVFLVAFALLWTLGDFSFIPAVFLAAIIAAIVWLVLYIGFSPKKTGDDAMASTSASSSTSAPASPAAAPVAATAAAANAPSAEAAEAKRKADEQAAERAAAEAARNKAEAEEAAEAKRKADEAAAADAKRQADEAAAAEAAEAKRRADEAAAADAKRQADEAAAAEAAEAKRRADEAAAAEARRAEEAAAAAAPAAQPAMTDNAAAATTPDYDGDGVREGTDEGTRPAGLDAPRDGKADDLKQIKGIGAKMEALCNRLGFWHFDQIAAWSADEVAWVDANLEGFKGRVTRDTWVEQAGVLAGGGETEFSKRVEDGDVY